MTALFVRAMTEEGTSAGDRVSESSSSSSSSGVDTEHHRHDDCSTAVDLQRISPLVMPSAVEQRAIISSLESQDRGPAEEQRGVPESSGRQYVYTVSSVPWSHKTAVQPRSSGVCQRAVAASTCTRCLGRGTSDGPTTSDWVRHDRRPTHRRTVSAAAATAPTVYAACFLQSDCDSIVLMTVVQSI